MKKLLLILFIIANQWITKAQNQIIGHEYWFDNNIEEKISTAVAPSPSLNLDLSINTFSLVAGVHLLNFRTKDNAGKYSAIASYFFLKKTFEDTADATQLVAYEYWFDENTTQKIRITDQIPELSLLNIDFNAESIPVGVHLINLRIKDQKGRWSHIESKFFYKNGINPAEQKGIERYRYWLKDFPDDVVTVKLPQPQFNFLLQANLDLKPYQKGNYILNYQFFDSKGVWSAIHSTTITKNAFPVAEFDFTRNENSDSTILHFMDKSIDADIFKWKFGNGDSSDVQNPFYVYKQAGAYVIQYKIKDMASGLTSLRDSIILIRGRTYSSINTQSCGSFSSPSGKFIWNTTGIYRDTLLNSWAMDSVITINLAVFPVTNPSVPVSSDVSRCGPGTVSLTATGCIGGIIKWYLQSTGGQSVYNGSSYVTPILNQTTSYYVACEQNVCESIRKEVKALLQINITHLPGSLLPGTYKVSQSIQSRATVSTSTIYQAGQTILLNPGFQAPKGTVFKASIGVCN